MSIEINIGTNMHSVDVGFLPPEFNQYKGQRTFFQGEPPLSQGVGYMVVLGFGVFFSIITTAIVLLNKNFGTLSQTTSEHFNTAGRLIKTGLTASVIVSQWTWAATLLQSSNVAHQYGVAGAFWYAAGATIQILLFGNLAIKVKKIAPSAHTVAEIVNARWGKRAHITFLSFCLATNIIVTAMLLLGGAATVHALTGMDYRIASFLIPWGVIMYTALGGLQATFIASYMHTVIIFAVLVSMIFLVYIKAYSSDMIHDYLSNAVSKTPGQCEAIFSDKYGTSFWSDDSYSCGPVGGNSGGSYLTILSSGGLMFGIINIIGNFGTVFVDQSYWQSAIAACPEGAAKGYFLGGICWFSIPFALATSLGLASTALMLPITAEEASQGLVPPAIATHLLGEIGSLLILIMVFMAIVSTGSVESIAVSSLLTYDVYRTYVNPDASGEMILDVSRLIIVMFGLFMGFFAVMLHELVGVNLGWMYLSVGVFIGSAVFPLWNLLTWKKASGDGAVIAVWCGLALALIAWTTAAKILTDEITIESLGTNEAMLSGNLTAVFSSGFIHWFWSTVIDPQDYNFDDLEKHITLVDDDRRGLSEEERDPVLLSKAENWIKIRSWALTFVLVGIWPLLSIPAGVFTKSFFAFWVLVAILWGLGAAFIATVLPIYESWDNIIRILNGMYLHCTGRNLFDEFNDSEMEKKSLLTTETTTKKQKNRSKESEASIEETLEFDRHSHEDESA